MGCAYRYNRRYCFDSMFSSALSQHPNPHPSCVLFMTLFKFKFSTTRMGNECPCCGSVHRSITLWFAGLLFAVQLSLRPCFAFCHGSDSIWRELYLRQNESFALGHRTSVFSVH